VQKGEAGSKHEGRSEINNFTWNGLHWETQSENGFYQMLQLKRLRLQG
jgi:hypothetical protein